VVKEWSVTTNTPPLFDGTTKKTTVCVNVNVFSFAVVIEVFKNDTHRKDFSSVVIGIADRGRVSANGDVVVDTPLIDHCARARWTRIRLCRAVGKGIVIPNRDILNRSINGLSRCAACNVCVLLGTPKIDFVRDFKSVRDSVVGKIGVKEARRNLADSC